MARQMNCCPGVRGLIAAGPLLIGALVLGLGSSGLPTAEAGK
jgi:hypothetical protein